MEKQALPRVVHLASGDLWAGAEAQLFTLAVTLHKKLGIPVAVILLNHGELEERLRNAGIEVTVLDESGMNALHILYNLVRLIKRINPDIVHTHRIKENILGSFAARLSGVASIRTAHGAPEHRPDWWHLPKRLIRMLDLACGRFLQSRIIAVTDDLATILAREYPVDAIRVIENGIDIDAIEHHASATTRPVTTTGAPFRIGLAGRLVPVKRVDLFIRAAQHISSNHPELGISFHIFGDGPLRGDLEQLARTLAVDNLVHFEGHCDDIYRQLQDIDVLLMTSDHEGLPMILLEAMTLGTPVIAHAVGGIPKLLDNGRCGVLVHDHSGSGYARAIHDLLREPARLGALIENARARVKTDYSAVGNAERYLAVYREPRT